MRNLHQLDRWRDTAAEMSVYKTHGDGTCGVFRIKSPIDSGTLTVVASAGDQWDHVSVSRGSRCPNWPEMEHIKRLFFEPFEAAMQLHVPVADHINAHPYTLHLWRPHKLEIPRPPGWMVA